MAKAITYNDTHIADAWDYFEANHGDNTVYEVYDMELFSEYIQRIFETYHGIAHCITPFSLLAKDTYNMLVSLCELPEDKDDENLYVILCKDWEGNVFLEEYHKLQFYDEDHVPVSYIPTDTLLEIIEKRATHGFKKLKFEPKDLMTDLIGE
uniref:Uncharacterized protein n=1 Tax=viral metagenome TaxID=1070528 RepID=A0A6C0EMC3_9ZZZZ